MSEGGGEKRPGNRRNILVDNLLKRYNATPALQRRAGGFGSVPGG